MLLLVRVVHCFYQVKSEAIVEKTSGKTHHLSVVSPVIGELLAERQQLQLRNADEYRLTVSVVERDLRIAQIEDDLALLGYDPHRPVEIKKPKIRKPVVHWLPSLRLSALVVQGICAIVVLVMVLSRNHPTPVPEPTSPIDPYAYLTRPERIELPAPSHDREKFVDVDESIYLMTETDNENCGMDGLTCAADQYCSHGHCVVRPAQRQCVPTAEVCDNMDNDCNGLIDEVFSLISDHENCGMCGLSCSQDQVCQNAHCVWKR